MKLSFDRLKTEFYHYRTLIFVLFAFFVTASFSFFATRDSDSSLAVSTAGFNPGNIISDAVMSNYNSMSVSDIQRFLTEKNSCNNHDYQAYLDMSATYPTVKWYWTGGAQDGHFVCLSEERFGDGLTVGTGQTAAEIIYAAAQEYKINPQVLLVLLEKEQGLISDPYPHSGQYRIATGYGCPDTAACDSKYFGFKNQINRAAELFRYTLDHGYSLYPEKKKGVYVAYNPSASCGRSEVYIENRATAALYRYTPYQPNAAALAAGYGTGDACSAYGNRNFYLYFTQWFGSTQADPAAPETPDVEDGSGKNDPSGDDNQSSIETPSAPPQLIPDGIYTINSSTNSAEVLDVANGRDADGSNIQLWTSNNTVSQQWKIAYDSSTHDYTIRNVISDRALDLNAGIVKDSSNIQLWTYNSTCSQHWNIIANGSGSYIITSACNNNYALDISDGKIKDGSNIQLWTKNGTVAQAWNITLAPK